jgi:hypothetical protein
MHHAVLYTAGTAIAGGIVRSAFLLRDSNAVATGSGIVRFTPKALPTAAPPLVSVLSRLFVARRP